MQANMSNDRRRFLRNVGLSVGGMWLTLNSGPVLAAAVAAQESQSNGHSFSSFSSAQGEVLGAVADQIYPPDDVPGAKELGAVFFMDQALQGFMAGAAPMILGAVDQLDSAAMERFGKPYSQLEFDDQTALLKDIEATPFFGTVHFLTLCGCFSLPEYGGNKDGGGWAQIGFERRHVWQPPFGHYDAQAARENADGSA